MRRSLLALLLGALCVLALLCSAQAQASSQTLQVSSEGRRAAAAAAAAASEWRTAHASCRVAVLYLLHLLCRFLTSSTSMR